MNIAQLYYKFSENQNNLITATKYISPNLTVRLSRKRHNKNVYDKRKARVFVIDKKEHRIDFVLCVGAPNYLERDFIKSCKKAGEPFPIKKIQLKYQKNK